MDEVDVMDVVFEYPVLYTYQPNGWTADNQA